MDVPGTGLRGDSGGTLSRTYGKELFHSIKQPKHHAKHNLQLIKWPVLITNRVALAIAGL